TSHSAPLSRPPPARPWRRCTRPRREPPSSAITCNSAAATISRILGAFGHFSVRFFRRFAIYIDRAALRSDGRGSRDRGLRRERGWIGLPRRKHQPANHFRGCDTKSAAKDKTADQTVLRLPPDGADTNSGQLAKDN